MIQAFVIVLREGFEAFLIVAISLAYLRKIGQSRLLPAAYWGIGVSILASFGVAYLLMQGVNQALWEALLGLVAVVMVTSFVIHLWRPAPRIKQNIQTRLSDYSMQRSRWGGFFGVFLFIVLMITREGMETALMLLQVRDRQFLTGAFLGLGAAVVMSGLWARLGHRINLKRFFQVTGIFLLLFALQVAVYSFHEFSEAGVLPASEAIHQATERFSPTGLYGQWFSLVMVGICGAWLIGSWLADRFHAQPAESTQQSPLSVPRPRQSP